MSTRAFQTPRKFHPDAILGYEEVDRRSPFQEGTMVRDLLHYGMTHGGRVLIDPRQRDAAIT